MPLEIKKSTKNNNLFQIISKYPRFVSELTTTNELSFFKNYDLTKLYPKHIQHYLFDNQFKKIMYITYISLTDNTLRTFIIAGINIDSKLNNIKEYKKLQSYLRKENVTYIETTNTDKIKQLGNLHIQPYKDVKVNCDILSNTLTKKKVNELLTTTTTTTVPQTAHPDKDIDSIFKILQLCIYDNTITIHVPKKIQQKIDNLNKPSVITKIKSYLKILTQRP